MTNLIGQSLGRYHILERLGEGGMATVYKAYDTRLERDVAVKVLRTEQFAPAVLERILKRFEREAKALARLTHPNIVPIIDYGEHDGAPYLVMPYFPGGTLKQRLKDLGKPIPWPEALRLLLPIARALEYAHQQSILHRDVKPSNILITQSGEPMLTDFGVAKILDIEDGQTLTGTGMGVGTPEYMAPEQWTGKVTPQSDVYALGVVLYEMVTGRKPFQADTPMAVALKQATESLPRPTQFVPDLPEAVERILLKALAKQPQDRYGSMAEMAAAMEKAVLGAEGRRQTADRPPSTVYGPPSLDDAATVDQGVTGETVMQEESNLQNKEWWRGNELQAMFKQGVAALQRQAWCQAYHFLDAVFQHDPEYQQEGLKVWLLRSQADQAMRKEFQRWRQVRLFKIKKGWFDSVTNWSVVFSADGRYLFVGCSDGKVRRISMASEEIIAWDTGTFEKVFWITEYSNQVLALAVSSKIQIWDTEGSRIRTLEGH
ncbi:MAG: WD40 repeat domain-containing serine/threonine protein kinase, partial [Anaerolineales bacterium]